MKRIYLSVAVAMLAFSATAAARIPLREAHSAARAFEKGYPQLHGHVLSCRSQPRSVLCTIEADDLVIADGTAPVSFQWQDKVTRDDQCWQRGMFWWESDWCYDNHGGVGLTVQSVSLTQLLPTL